MESDAEKIFTDLKGNISTYAGLKLRLLKLTAIERTANVLSGLSHGFILLLFTFFTVLFLFVALGFYLGDLLENIALGFLIVGGIHLLLTLCFLWAKRGICMHLTNTIITALQTDNDDNDGEKNQSTDTTRTTPVGETGPSETMPGVGNEN